MVERKIERSFRIEEDTVIAVKRDEWTNGLGKKIVQVVEEHGITDEEIIDVLDNQVKEEIKKIDEEMAKIMSDSDDIQREIEEGLEKQEDKEKYEGFKEYIKLESYSKFAKLFRKEQVIEEGKKNLEQLNKQREDILAWKKQFEDIQKAKK